MSDTRVELRTAARGDIRSAVEYLRDEVDETTALRFVDDLERGLGHLAVHPLSGSMRLGFELDIPGLRSWTLERFPYLVFYVVDGEVVDIWRVLHARRNLIDALGRESPPEV